MITKYVYGTPIETDAVIKEIEKTDNPPQFLTAVKKDDTVSFSYTMDESDIVYGLGETVRGINKRGWIYESYCADDPIHTETKKSLYGAHNFIIISGKNTFGIFVDTPAKVTFDIGYTDLNSLEITPAEPNLALYIITGSEKKDIVKQFRQLIGKSYIAPLWAFGFQQSRWGYKSDNEIKEVAKGYRDNNIPLDAIYMDIDYMVDFKDFTVDEKKFPDFKNFVKEMKEQDIRLVPIIDAGVKIEKGYDVYEEGVKNDYFCKDENGKDFISAVWPGLTHFPDFLKEDARKWFGNKYKSLIDMGIEGFWNDMNEPAIFYSKKKLDKAWEKVFEYKDKNLDINSFFELRDIFANLVDYDGFFHTINGEKICHNRVHNIYGFNMTKCAFEAFERIDPDKRFLMFSRSSYIGMHRYGGIWTGDNQSWWSHIALCLKQLPALNMCGFLYIGSDIGGFGDHTTEDLLLRWLALGAFTPLMRNHAALGTRDQECYRFNNKERFRSVIGARYSLIPYIYSEYMKAALNDEMMFKPLSFDYPDDEFSPQVEDQLMVGDSIMIAPVYEQNAKGRYVYLPEDMLFVKLRGDKRTCEILKKGHHYIAVSLDEVPLFIKENCLLPLAKPAQSTAELDYSCIDLLGFITKEGSYNLYNDDGITKSYSEEYIKITAVNRENDFNISVSDNNINVNKEIYGGIS